MEISFVYGTRQRFRHRYEDVTIAGRVAAAASPVRRASWRLNDATPVPLYVEHVPDVYLRAGRDGSWFMTPIDWRVGYKDSPAGLRLKELGEFCVEIPVAHPGLVAGRNEVEVEVEDHGKVVERAGMAFEWDPRPVELPLDLTDPSGVDDVQSIGQVVTGRWRVDREHSSIESVAPVAPDALLLLGGRTGSQEATYRISSGEPRKAKYVGLSDFFVRHEAEEPPIGIKPGWSTAGMATVRFDGEARSWIAFGDNSTRREGWLAVTEPPREFLFRADVPYRVRHQVLFEAGEVRTRFRIWPEDDTEPSTWLCEESSLGVDPSKPRFREATFGLFQHTGAATAWSDIRVDPLSVDDA